MFERKSLGTMIQIFLIMLFFMPVNNLVLAGEVDHEISTIEQICSKHGEDFQAAYTEANTYFESLPFSTKLKIAMELDKKLLQEKQEVFVKVIYQLFADHFKDRQHIVTEHFSLLIDVIYNRQYKAEARRTIIYWLLVHRKGYHDTSYMTEEMYEEAHSMFKNLALDKDEDINIRRESIRCIEWLTHDQLAVALRRYPEGKGKLQAREEIGQIIDTSSLTDKKDINIRINKVRDCVDVLNMLLDDKETPQELRKPIIQTLTRLKGLDLKQKESIDLIIEKHSKTE